MNKIIITAAITGAIHTPSMSPFLPITPDEIIDEVVRVYESGGAVAHIHIRDPKSGYPSSDIELLRYVVTSVKKRCNIILCISTGGRVGSTTAERVSAISSLKPELASLNSGSMNFALFPLVNKIDKFKFDWEKEYLCASEETIFSNTFKTMREYLQVYTETETKPELEIYDCGMINNIAFMIREGYIEKPVNLQFVLGVLGGMPPSTDNLLFLYNSARNMIGEFNWSVCTAGRYQLPMCTMALTMGGNVRVGLEDNLYIGLGVLAKSNAEQVEKMIRIANELGLEIADPDEARQILGLKGLDNVNW